MKLIINITLLLGFNSIGEAKEKDSSLRGSKQDIITESKDAPRKLQQEEIPGKDFLLDFDPMCNEFSETEVNVAPYQTFENEEDETAGWFNGRISEGVGDNKFTKFLGPYSVADGDWFPCSTYTVPDVDELGPRPVFYQFSFYEIDSFDGFNDVEGNDAIGMLIAGGDPLNGQGDGSFVTVDFGTFHQNSEDNTENLEGVTEGDFKVEWTRKPQQSMQMGRLSESTVNNGIDQRHDFVVEIPTTMFNNAESWFTVCFMWQLNGVADEFIGIDDIKSTTCRRRITSAPTNAPVVDESALAAAAAAAAVAAMYTDSEPQVAQAAVAPEEKKREEKLRPGRCNVDNDCNTDNQYCDNDGKCGCFQGYYAPSGKGGACQDLNECQESSSNRCDKNARCTNLVGNYSCQCNDEFQGNGLSCKRIKPRTAAPRPTDPPQPRPQPRPRPNPGPRPQSQPRPTREPTPGPSRFAVSLSPIIGNNLIVDPEVLPPAFTLSLMIPQPATPPPTVVPPTPDPTQVPPTPPPTQVPPTPPPTQVPPTPNPTQPRTSTPTAQQIPLAAASISSNSVQTNAPVIAPTKSPITPQPVSSPSNCDGRGRCASGASCVEEICQCDEGYMADPNLPANQQSIAGWRSCVTVDECSNPALNVCEDSSNGGYCVNYDPPEMYQCGCQDGYFVIEDSPFGPTACSLRTASPTTPAPVNPITPAPVAPCNGVDCTQSGTSTGNSFGGAQGTGNGFLVSGGGQSEGGGSGTGAGGGQSNQNIGPSGSSGGSGGGGSNNGGGGTVGNGSNGNGVGVAGGGGISGGGGTGSGNGGDAGASGNGSGGGTGVGGSTGLAGAVATDNGSGGIGGLTFASGASHGGGISLGNAAGQGGGGQGSGLGLASAGGGGASLTFGANIGLQGVETSASGGLAIGNNLSGGSGGGGGAASNTLLAGLGSGIGQGIGGGSGGAGGTAQTGNVGSTAGSQGGGNTSSGGSGGGYGNGLISSGNGNGYGLGSAIGIGSGNAGAGLGLGFGFLP